MVSPPSSQPPVSNNWDINKITDRAQIAAVLLHFLSRGGGGGIGRLVWSGLGPVDSRWYVLCFERPPGLGQNRQCLCGFENGSNQAEIVARTVAFPPSEQVFALLFEKSLAL